MITEKVKSYGATRVHIQWDIDSYDSEAENKESINRMVKGTQALHAVNNLFKKLLRDFMISSTVYMTMCSL